MKTTVDQAELLKKLKLPVPLDFYAASRLITFALKGNDNSNHDAKCRRALIRSYWSRWVGKLVRIVQAGHFFQGACGRVEYLQARNKEEMRQITDNRLARKPLPFIAVVRLDPADANTFIEIHLTGLKKVHVVQKRLFAP
ncbi:hypothetical protein GOV10_02885 [Candidatus Woesearchaeota archaeon]|nr:hypothetical protein [Candidatus Woesearchaeota archaeon]